ncbi:MAG: outer membrane lipoprotein chaperone LolA [Pigmentiphaga sp.]|uniref:outer membrane lipoprotein chaperone LolA n=1 Tax=Pigmentiphaga sp. TaxID=1977564 RepID=UPI0029AD4717|nr:outer membrane lipoprotein chaperone LolA [Pigmentiphaga sp.]MDX3907685.1 outer membrane lipoprotein chaperone LolA [Pigmentiphaga sp.]
MNFVSKTAAILARTAATAGLALALAVPGVVRASAIDQLHAFAGNTQSARGSFSQVTRGNGSQAAPVQSGEFAFQRPGRFRWQVSKPYEQLIVSDGKELFQYDPDLSQVTVRTVGEAIGSSPAQILFGSGSLEQSFNVAEQPERDGLQWLRATPKSPDAGFSRVDIAFKDGLPARLELLDAFGQTTSITFTGIVRNPQLPQDSFRFTAPAGVDVVRMDGQQPAGAR